MSVWTSWLTELAREHPLDVLFYLGCDDPDLPRLLSEQTNAPIILANCNPSVQEETAELVAHSDRLRLWPKALSASSDKAPFHVLSLPGLSAQATPQELYKLFPNLRLLETCEVPAGPLSTLLAEAPRGGPGPRVLRAELAGAEAELSEQMQALPHHESLDHLFLRLPADGLYERQGSSADILSRLTEQGYVVQARSDADPDFPEYWLRRDAAKHLASELAEAQDVIERQKQELGQSLSASKARIEELSQALVEQEARTLREVANTGTVQAKLEAAQQQHAAQIAHKNARIEELSRALIDQEARTLREAETAQRERDALHREDAAQIAQRDARIAELSQTLTDKEDSWRRDAAALLAERDAASRSAEETRVAAQADAEQSAQTDRTRELEAEVETLRERTSDDLLKAQQDLDAALRMQSLLQGDLQDLRRRHQDLLADREAQDELLQEVTEKLAPLLGTSGATPTAASGKSPKVRKKSAIHSATRRSGAPKNG